jgi:pilus assembly protein CpaE
MRITWMGLADESSILSSVDQAVEETGNRIHWMHDEDELIHALKKQPYAVIFMASSSRYDVFELCEILNAAHQNIAIILIILEKGFHFRNAMCGAVDAILKPFEKEEILKSIQKAEKVMELKMSQHGGKLPKKVGRVITIHSTKGGVGKTTISVNLSASLSRDGYKVAVLDIDLQFGDVSILFDLEPERTMYEWVKEDFEKGKQDIQAYMSKHSSGVDILAAPTRPELAEIIKGDHIEYLITNLRGLYDYLIIDTSPSLVETSLVAIEKSDDILLITSLDIPTLKNVKIAIETLELLNLSDKIKVIVNRDEEKGGLKLKTVEDILGKEVFSSIISDHKTVISSLNTGKPFVLTNPKSEISQGIMNLSRKLQDRPPLFKKRLFSSMLIKR